MPCCDGKCVCVAEGECGLHGGEKVSVARIEGGCDVHQVKLRGSYLVKLPLLPTCYFIFDLIIK